LPLEILEAEGQAEDGDSAGSEQTQSSGGSGQFSFLAKSKEQIVVHDNIALADLQNPWDALEILAQVAERAEDDDFPGSEQTQGNNSQQKQFRPAPWDDDIHYKPMQDGMISPEMVYHLFLRFAVALYFTLIFLT
jgi:hypothetical protein